MYRTRTAPHRRWGIHPRSRHTCLRWGSLAAAGRDAVVPRFPTRMALQSPQQVSLQVGLPMTPNDSEYNLNESWSINGTLSNFNRTGLIVPSIPIYPSTSTTLCPVAARRWNDTGKGSIAFEEAWTIPELISQTTSPVLAANLLDIHNQRLAQMDETGIDYGISDQAEAEAMARNVNDQLAAAISNNTFRFGGFATLAMHNATTAGLELERAVQDLLYYDQPEYDVFWEMLQDLEYQHSVWLLGAGQVVDSPMPFAVIYFYQEFAATLSTHILGLCANGVFENASSYWKTNLLETTSGNFATELVELHGNQIGLSRIMYSVDYPFVAMQTGQDWLKSLEKTMEAKDLVALKRGLAVNVLHLDDR
ncbi:hypothetical protein GGX14DRAFT_384027 [Mycena pura]|uniref:Amidohydrolase-related domain-containing protein n=1 Tax=Mycena pura TaxID=153505 RepID=A0AAD6YUL3_9AGAR|nr:hypothetical protein GGX14DRAFT_384027 [Mycena pura]